MAERVLSMHEVAGSIPAFSRNKSASGLVVKSNVPNVRPRVRFPAGACINIFQSWVNFPQMSKVLASTRIRSDHAVIA